jgi:hypothetical protein
MGNRIQAELNGHVHPAAATVTTGVNGQADHGADGRFTHGNKAATGNPFNRRMARLRNLLFDCVSDEDIKEIARQLVKAARQGDTAAAKLLFVYLMGRPTAAPDPDFLDKQEYLLRASAPQMGDVWAVLTQKPFAEALQFLVNVAPTITPLFEAGPLPERKSEAD